MRQEPNNPGNFSIRLFDTVYYPTDEEIKSCIIEADFNGQYKVKIEKDGKYGKWEFTNAMNGYGNNCKDEIFLYVIIDLGICQRGMCVEPAVIDYNGCGHFVCKSCDNHLELEFEDYEY